ncbi:hypothetical protein A3I57_02775 [Candidatus Beckwithbacteria bacterium RIFCSPLOWO2_02_FULL_47_23]|uniref:SurA N-terminal domain-containing protein n=2 Tax=Candidatus Beckwithiibacteriota TaxID=1752726 RepID=A0A1F5E2M3_9BACT|nr:MAG: hypothetical protein A3E73_03320 [Candidatus Beckwithbacteria bacterium RIFCSPHIGHO2_12_FULL_47_17]OGD61608.1 MAG: hypothetical protein A3I57_02775 [Candidatus Beckwithbacteria bacterium RIFCSPLOWO2_02_FULL_47_23]
MPAKKSNRLSRKHFVYLAIILGLSGLLYFFKDRFVVAWVNGKPITRIAYVRELEKLAKNQAVDSLLTKQLIIAEAAKQKITVAKEEVDEAMTNIEERAKTQGTTLDELLTAQGVSLQSVREEVKLQKLLEKMVGEITVAEDQISSYFKDNQAALYKDLTLDEVKNDISEQLKQQELINKIQELIAKLQAEAQVVKWQK